VKGHLDAAWSDWFHGLHISDEEDGTSALVGELQDQAALHGVLCTMRDLGLLIVSLSCHEIGTTAAAPQSM
jgi:hypothetical protein